MFKVRPFVQKMKPYFVLQDAEWAKLNQNESPYDIPQDIKQEIVRRFQDVEWQRYPRYDPRALTQALSRAMGHPADGILIGSGSSEMLQVTIHALCEPGDRIAQVVPTFPLYPLLAGILSLDLRDIPLGDAFQFDVPAMIEGGGKTRLILAASPNNPTGTVLTPDEVETVLQSIPGILVLDEAYYEFYGKSALGLLKKYDNLLIVRTFSKALGFAGIRIGYLLGRPELIHEIGKVKLPYSVGVFQQIAGEVVLQYGDRMRKLVGAILKEKDRVFNALLAMPGVDPFPSETNFILLRILEKPAGEIYEALARQGILVRYADKPRVEDCIRVTIGSEEENTGFLRYLQETFV